MHGGDAADRRAWPVVSPARTDRILVGLCAAVWLALLGMAVAATVALVDLGRGFHRTGNPHTPAVLYAIIIVSTLVILAAIPVLVYARRRAVAERFVRPPGFPAAGGGAQRRTGHPPPRAVAGEVRTQWLSVRGPVPAQSEAAAGRIWLRGTVALVGAMGTALVAVAAATYLMAIGREGAAWTGYGVAGIVTAVMPAIPWRHLRQLRRLRESPWPSR